MDKKRSLLNVSVSIGFKFVIIILEIFVRRFLIRYVGNEINGLNSLYISILDFLAIAELGVGGAITYCMYQPIVDGDREKTAALYHLFQKLYWIIGAVIVVVGCAIMPLLPYLAKDYAEANVNLYLTFALMLSSVAITYLFSAKTSLINAYKDNYIVNTVSSLGRIVQCGLQMLVLFLTGSFIWYLVCRIISSVLQWVATETIARYKHGDIIKIKSSVDSETKKEVTKNVKAMFMHKIGGILVNTADSIIISSFIGILILGKYSNYTAIVIAMTSVLTLCFTPLTSVVGHMFVEEGRETAKKYCGVFHTLNFVLGMVFFLGYYAVADNLVGVLFGAELELAKSVSFVITLNYFIQFMRQGCMLFRDATGTFYNDRWKPLFEGIINIGLSVLFVCVFPEDYKVVGVIAATIITNLFICHIIEPYVLYKHAFRSGMKQYYVQNYAYILIFGGILAALNFSMVTLENQWLELLANGGIALALSIVPCIAAIVLNRDFSNIMKNILRKIFRRRVQSETVSDVCNDPKFSASDSEEKSADGENNSEEDRP
ncbi:MAG: hypothetical protein HFE27_05635 [Clostridia bacterium]|jgi:O-antigen/teichoic acid export membrane protein|nr:hypothetical protein [Clostridia bacterium]